MLRAILRPDVLFTVATIQALSPYVFWQFGIGEFKGQAGLTYYPVFIWIAGWVAFMLGAHISRPPVQPTPLFRVACNTKRLQMWTVLMMVVIAAQLISLVRLYGGAPILSYIRQDGAIKIGTAVALQDESGIGQVGSVYITTAVLHGLVLLLAICNLEQKRRNQLLLLSAAIILLCAHSINGKRQGFVRCAVFLVTGIAMYAKDPLDALARATRLMRSKATAGWALGICAALLFLSFGYLAYVRNQGHYKRGSLEELVVYQEYSLVNFEGQCAVSGLGPGNMNVFLWLRRLVPWKLMDAVGLGDRDMPLRYEPWAPAGLYEDLQWSLGLYGVIGFSFGLGFVTTWIYRRVGSSVFYLLSYSQISFSLMMAHSFNEFVSISWIPAPLCMFALVCSTLRRQTVMRALPMALGTTRPEYA